jgi:hypothetical protein
MGPRATVIGDDGPSRSSMTDTVAVQYASFRDACTPGWDKIGGAGQKIDRIEERAGMGVKNSPIGRGVATSRRAL